MDVYTLAESSDPTYREANAFYREILEFKPQANSQLMPNVNLNARTSIHHDDITLIGSGVGVSGEGGYTRKGYSLDITQPLYRYDLFLAVDQADSRINQALAELNFAQQDLITRVAVRYFLVLGAYDNLAFAQSEKKSLLRQLEQAKQRFEVGLTAITDVQEAQAGYDRAVANEILAENTVDDALENLREITGKYHTDFRPLGKSMPLVSPEPDDIEAWTNIALKQNQNIIAAKYNLETTRQEIKIQNAGHYPTLDLVANYGFDSSGSVRFGATEVDSTAIGLELNVPLFEGGLVNSKTRQAQERFNQSMEKLMQQHRAAQRETREAYRGVISGISQVKALKQALISTETALQATAAGFEVGTRTAVDVVASERATLQAKRDYARSRYDYILNSLLLKKAAGTLSPEDLQQVNNLLE